jgi:3-hydroxybutyryl-CoA dehydrogenase
LLIRFGLQITSMVRPFIGGNFCQNWGAICAAAMGPTTLFHLGAGAGAGGLQAFCEHFADTFHGWWDELGHAKLDEDTIKILVDGIADAHGDASQADLSAARDALILAMQQATKPLR